MKFTKMHGLGNDYLYVFGEVPEDIRELFRNIPAPDFPVFTPFGKSHRSGALLPSFPFPHPAKERQKERGNLFLCDLFRHQRIRLFTVGF